MVGKVKVLLICSGNDGVGVGVGAIDNTVIPLKLYLKTLERRLISGSLAAIVSYYCFIILAAVVFRASGIVSVVCSIVLSKGSLTTAAT